MAFIFNPNKKRGVFMIPSGATKSPTPTPPSFINNYSLSFDGIDDKITITEADYSGAFTFSFWAKPTINGTFVMGLNSGFGHFVWLRTDVIIRLRINGVQYEFTESVGNNIVLNQWQNIIITRDSSNNINCYRNGVAFGGSSTLSGTFKVDSIGGGMNLNTWDFTGNLDEVAFWNNDQTANISTISTSPVVDLTSLNPVAWYRNGDNGTFKNPQWLIPNNENKTKFSNYSFLYDGIDNYIDTGITTTGTNDVSISCWIKTSETFAYSESRCAFGGSDVTFGANYTLGRLGSEFGSPNDMKVRVFNTFGTTKLNDNSWHNIIYTYDYTSKEVKVYVDGNNTPEISATVSLFRSKEIAIGWNGKTSSYHFEGNVDECAYFTSILGASDITSIYNSGVPNDLASLSPVGYWRSEQSNFTDNWLIDNSALSNYSTRSFNFDGVDDSINTGFSSLDGASEFTISCWVNSSYTDWMNLFGDNSIRFATKPSITRLDLSFDLAVVFRSYDFVLNVGQWHNVVITFDGSLVQANRLKVYVDTVQVTNSLAGTPSTTFTASSDFRIGRSGTSGINEWNGNIDEFAVWDSVQNITSIYNSGTPARIEGAVSHWRMGEDATFNTNWNVPDNVGSATGTSSNMTISDLQGEAPNYTGGGLSNNMTIEDRVGDAPNSTSNALSYNMDEADRETDVPT